MDLIDERMDVRRMIEAGEISQAIKKIDEINELILSERPELHFELLRQQLVELIKKGQIHDAIGYAQAHLSSQSLKKEAYQAEVDRTMTMLMYEDLSKSPMAELASQAHRQRLAGMANKAILQAMGHQSDLKLEFFYKMMLFSQEQLAD